MDEELRKLEREIRSDPDLRKELARIREEIRDFEQSLDIRGREQRLAEARASGDEDAVKRESLILEERRKALERTRESLIDHASPKIRKLARTTQRSGMALFSLVAIFVDSGIGVIDAINNNDSLLGPIYRAALDGECSRALALIRKKSLEEHALDLKPITGASALATEEILEEIFNLVRQACHRGADNE